MKMPKELILYHGSKDIIEQPAFGAGRKNNDYGRGFYCTEDEELAKEWACSSLRDGFANRYSIDSAELRILDLSTPDYTILHWLSVLVSHRLFRPESPVAGKGMRYLQERFAVNVNAYDLIRGYRADDAYYDFANAFLNNTITVEQLARAMQLGKLGEQVVLKSRYAFQMLQIEGYQLAAHDSYYSKRKARNDAAEAEYRAITEEMGEGLYLIDLIREEVNADDARIPRSVPIQCDAESGTGI